MTSDRPSPSSDNSDDLTREQRLEQSLVEMQRLSEELRQEESERDRRLLEQKNRDRAIVDDKELNIDEAKYRQAIELAQVFANHRYKDTGIWWVSIEREVFCLPEGDDRYLTYVANRVTNEITVCCQTARYTAEEASAIIQVLLNGEGK